MAVVHRQQQQRLDGGASSSGFDVIRGNSRQTVVHRHAIATMVCAPPCIFNSLNCPLVRSFFVPSQGPTVMHRYVAVVHRFLIGAVRC